MQAVTIFKSTWLRWIIKNNLKESVNHCNCSLIGFEMVLYTLLGIIGNLVLNVSPCIRKAKNRLVQFESFLPYINPLIHFFNRVTCLVSRFMKATLVEEFRFFPLFCAKSTQYINFYLENNKKISTIIFNVNWYVLKS